MSIPPLLVVEWGRIEFWNSEESLIFKDAILSSDARFAQEWDWKKSETKHEPGVTSQVMDELPSDLLSQTTQIIFSSGFCGQLQLTPDLIDVCRERKIPYTYCDTPTAIQKFNEAAKQQRVVIAFLHSTC